MSVNLSPSPRKVTIYGLTTHSKWWAFYSQDLPNIVLRPITCAARRSATIVIYNCPCIGARYSVTMASLRMHWLVATFPKARDASSPGTNIHSIYCLLLEYKPLLCIVLALEGQVDANRCKIGFDGQSWNASAAWESIIISTIFSFHTIKPRGQTLRQIS